MIASRCFLKEFCFQSNLTHPLLKFLNFRFYFCNRTFKNMNAKPPNILVYTGNSCQKLFKEISDNLQKCLRNDRYSIYHLSESEITEQPWMQNSLLLIVSSKLVKNSTAEVFETYLKNYGNILLICSNFNDAFMGSKCLQILDNISLTSVNLKEVGDTILYRGKYSYDTKGTVLYHDTSKKPVIHKVMWNRNTLICSEIYLDRDFSHSIAPFNYNIDNRLSLLKLILSEEFGLEVGNDNLIPQLTSGYYITKKEFENTKYLNQELINSLNLPVFHECKFNYVEKVIKLPIYFCKSSFPFIPFDINIYYSKLDSKVYGHLLVYFPVITSTMDVAKELSEHNGIVIIAGCQISGKGRGSNKWISPEGCAMFTLHFTISLSSKLGKQLSLLQHISSLAVVHSIRKQSAYKDLKLRIKWPNDIYYNEIKLGGLIVTSVVEKDIAHIYIGWGINVENSHPTTCINDIIEKYNLENFSALPHLSIEEVIASTVSQMEYFVKDFIENGSENFFTLYYSYWMHGDQEVTLKNFNEQGTIIGLDDYGFLRVKTKGGKLLALQPDGNRFDIMKNLIYSKK